MGEKRFIGVVQKSSSQKVAWSVFDPGSGDWYWSKNEEVEQLQDGGTNYAAAWGHGSEEEIIKPVEDIDKEERCGENSAGVAINVVWIFHNKDGCYPA